MITRSFRKHVLRRRSRSGNKTVLRHGNESVDVGQLVTSQLFSPPRPSVAEPDLHPGLGQFGALCELLPRVDVRVVRPFEGALQFFQLLGSESCTAASLLAFHLQSRL